MSDVPSTSEPILYHDLIIGKGHPRPILQYHKITPINQLLFMYFWWIQTITGGNLVHFVFSRELRVGFSVCWRTWIWRINFWGYFLLTCMIFWQYQRAVSKALMDRVPDEQASTITTVSSSVLHYLWTSATLMISSTRQRMRSPQESNLRTMLELICSLFGVFNWCKTFLWLALPLILNIIDGNLRACLSAPILLFVVLHR